MKILDKDLPIYFAGDSHGNWQEVFFQISRFDIRDCYYIHVGDGGEGFAPEKQQLELFEKLNNKFKERNVQYFSIRGNHSDPSYFTGDKRTVLSNFELIEDYTVYQYGDKKIQFIGGATSIDRRGRQKNVSYWVDEGVLFQPEKCEKVDMLVTHTAPARCYPQKFNEIVYGWSKEDPALIEDLLKERNEVETLFDLCKPSVHCYGHFHSSWSEEIDGCFHKLLNICELWECRLT
jgi:hypothetical protein